MRNLYLSLFLLVSVFVGAAVYVPSTVPDPKMFGQDYYVSNPDGILDEATVQNLNGLCADLNRKTTVEMAIVAIEAMDENHYYVETFAQKLFNQWGIGNSANNNGVLILLVVNSRDIRIQTGGGAEGILPDEVCADIIYDEMVPFLRYDDWDNGIAAGARAIYNELAKTENRAELVLGTQYADTETSDFYLNWLIWSCLIVIFLVVPLMAGKDRWKPDERSKKRYENAVKLNDWLVVLSLFFPIPTMFVSRWWRKKATKKYFLDKPFICKDCGKGQMIQLPPEEVTALLDPKQTLEQNLKSVSYEFWKCDNCGKQTMYRDLRGSNKYRECSACGAVAVALVANKVIKSATTLTSGSGVKTYKCDYCGYTHNVKYIIPRIKPTYSSSSGGYSSGRSSSSRSSSSGSWGGGRSYGGGASGKF